ncbi:hypothetical protein [Enterobacter ludwigii]|uniref:hypothetical protein n=1 Tax=Enterobacter ludwigii TaxID=299767 RepID=UPI003F7010F1
MANPKTPNLGLNKIDRSSPATTYFDLEKYIDQNADSVDEFAGRVNAAIEHAGERLDTVQRQDVLLNAGLQILNAQRRAAFSLSGIKGRTLVNLLGRDGNCDSLQGWPNNGRFTIDTTIKVEGSASIKATLLQGDPFVELTQIFRYDPSKCYVAVGEVKVPSGLQARIRMVESQRPETELSSEVILTSTGDGFRTLFFKVPKNAFSMSGSVYFGAVLVGTHGLSGNIDALRVYEISDSEYTVLSGMTPEQVAAKYPYVDSVQPVRNPYAIRYGENVLPPFHEWNTFSHATIRSLYEYSQVYTNGGWSYVEVPVHKDKEYNLSFEGTGGVKIAIFQPGDGGVWITDYSSESFTFNSGNNSKIRVVIAGDLPGTIKNPMLTLGSTPKPFKPREDSMLALQTDLYADPLTGMNADEVFEKDGQYFKLAKWKKVVSEGNQTWEFHSNGVGGFKKVKHKIPLDFPINGGQYAVKFDGKILKQDGSTSTVDSFSVFPFNGATTDINGYVFYQISNTDSGWGDNYTPTADEIKAYYMGWRMFQWGVGYDPYNGTGTKGWGKIYCGVGPNDGNGMVAGSGVSTLPTTMNDMGYTPYQLVYQLATPTAEPIVYEGMLTFNEGDNQIEVGTGIVVRESVKPTYYAGLSRYYININGHPNVPNVPLKNKTANLMRIYKNSLPDTWERYNDQYGYGGQYAFISASSFDTTAAYSVTYLMLDKSPIVAFTGSYAANEKAMLQELTDAVQQNATAVSVLMNKKADKDKPIVWIEPTLINGATVYPDTAFRRPSYSRTADGLVILSGLIRITSSTGSAAFILPVGYRPSKMLIFSCTTGGGNVLEVRVTTTGVLSPMAAVDWVSLEGIRFIAEQ